MVSQRRLFFRTDKGVIFLMDRTKDINQKKIIREISVKSKKRRNIFLQMFIFIFCAGYFLFFTSKAWYPDKSNLVKPTEIGKTNEWNGEEITVLSWTYSEAQKLMEIQMNIDSKELTDTVQLEFKALDKKQGYFPVEELMKKDNLYVLRIPVKKGWKEVSLRIQEKGDNSVEPYKVFTNNEKVTEVAKIQDLTENEYLVARIQSRIEKYEKDIYDLETENKKFEKDILEINENIADYRTKEQYQTAKEIQETENLIAQAESQINQINQSIAENTEMIQEYEERIRLAEEEKTKYQ